MTENPYEQEITNAGRSMLLVLFSMAGKAAGISLKPAFAALHNHRARKYRFEIRPEDFQSSLREIAGTFANPFGAHGIEVIDPSVLDLLNTVVRDAPDNLVDVVMAACDFEPIERAWSFANAQNSDVVREASLHNAEKLVAAISANMIKPRRFDMSEGTYGYRGSTFEHRLSVVVDMADRLKAPAVVALIRPLFARLQEEWTTERPDINDAVRALRVLEDAESLDPVSCDQLAIAIKAALIEGALDVCRSDELRELVGIIDISKPSADADLASVQIAFATYQQTMFQDELQDCRAREEYDALVEDLELFRDHLGVDVIALIEAVEDAKSEFEHNESNYADQMQDEYKERRYEERSSERSVSDMFGSLRGDQS